MYIKSIKAQGFKSFADKLELDLNPGICAIVGPNGSGKSNVVDALLWVLGEQSVKSLRGDNQMSDIIFSGSKTRDEAKKASVAITFNNEDHTLNSPFNEVEIKRVIYKSGENEYFINNSRVRLKDVTDLFIDVTSKFNIISQGNINALVENKSSERRQLFESASGVVKYKKRKEEALKKLAGTKENLTRIDLIIKELLSTLTPLEKQKNDALKYLSIKKDLETNEIALLVYDITTLNEKYQNLKNENKQLQKKMELTTLEKPEALEKLKLENLKLEEQINELNKSINSLTSQIAKLTSQKQIYIERKNYSLDKEKIDQNLINLNEEKLKFTRNIEVYEKEIEQLKNNVSLSASEYQKKSDAKLKCKLKISSLNNEINNLTKEIMVLQNKINIENTNLENSAFLPKSVSSIINNVRLKGIHNIIGKLYETEDKYELAINTALSSSANFIVVDDFQSAKKAIDYLKDNKLGRATFFPLDIIKSRYISQNELNELKKLNGFVGIASDLISFESLYRNIIENQLGNVIIIDSLENMDIAGKKTNYKYKIVSLDGQIIYPGGSIAGGSSMVKTSKKVINDLTSQINKQKGNLDTLNITLKKEEENEEILTKECDDLTKTITENRVIIDNKNNLLKDLCSSLEETENSISGLLAINGNALDDTLNKISLELNEYQKTKDLKELELSNSQSKKFDLNNEINELENNLQKVNNEHRKLENTIKNNDIEIGKCEVKIDSLLNTLTNDYSISFEYAQNNYELTSPSDSIRHKVNSLKNELKNLTDINVGSISEYDRLKKRYDFLTNQKNDLETSSQELYGIISEMDDIMKDKFKKTFDQISTEFSKVFRIMFKGGNGLLKLADENDLLNTGINIMAVPPGKKLNSTAFLSGGEKALTAICLIFAILNVKPVPFIVLDEAEAALDEENVNMFGEYLNNMKKTSQFILITHKKKMMEYADMLYGITMQESGVSKLVSVRLEDHD